MLRRRKFLVVALMGVGVVALLATALPAWASLINVGPDVSALAPMTASSRLQATRAKMDARVTIAERLAAAARLKAAGKAVPVVAAPSPGGTPNYFGPEPNWANSPPLRKFVDALPGLTAAGANNLGQYIPVAIPDTTTYPGLATTTRSSWVSTPRRCTRT